MCCPGAQFFASATRPIRTVGPWQHVVLGGSEYSSIEADKRLRQAHQSGDSQSIQETLKQSVPAGFKLMRAPDLGADRGDGYVWFEKVAGPEPLGTLTVGLPVAACVLYYSRLGFFPEY